MVSKGGLTHPRLDGPRGPTGRWENPKRGDRKGRVGRSKERPVAALVCQVRVARDSRATRQNGTGGQL